MGKTAALIVKQREGGADYLTPGVSVTVVSRARERDFGINMFQGSEGAGAGAYIRTAYLNREEAQHLQARITAWLEGRA